MKIAYVAGAGAGSCLAGIAILSLTALAVALIATGVVAAGVAVRLAYLNGRDEQ